MIDESPEDTAYGKAIVSSIMIAAGAGMTPSRVLSWIKTAMEELDNDG